MKEFIGPYGSSFVLVVALGFLNGVAGSVGVGIVIPLFSLFSNNHIAGTDFITRNVGRLFALLHLPLTPITLIVFMVLLFVVRGAAQFFAKYTSDKTAANVEENLRTTLLEKTLRAEWSYLLKQKVGYLERTLFFDINEGTNILTQIGACILTLTSLVTYAFIAFKISPVVTIATLAFGALLFPVFKPLFSKVRRLSGKVSATYKVVAHHIGEHIAGAKIVKATGTERRVLEGGAAYFHELKESRVHMSLYNYAMGTSIEPMGIAFVGLLFIFSYRSADFTIASFGVVVYLIQKMFSFIQSIQSQLQSFVSITPNMEHVLEYHKAASTHREHAGGSEKFVFQKTLELKDVSFSYDGKEKTLDAVNLSIPRGHMVGIVGPSGAGKTTVVDLLLRLFEHQSGAIMIDGKNLADIDIQAWRKHIGYVPQDVFLINDSIEKNIRFYDETITMPMIEQASKMANIYGFVQELPDRFATVVGERGVALSGGQRQRIVLARALARNPQILILDEATSAIDMESEKLIQDSIYTLKHKITIIVIAHRLSTIATSDHVVVLDHGRVTEQGPPGKLLADPASYFSKMHRTES